MKDGNKPGRGGDLDRRRSERSTSASRQSGHLGPAASEGRSGYGSDSVRPYLRAQLRLKELISGPRLSSERKIKP